MCEFKRSFGQLRASLVGTSRRGNGVEGPPHALAALPSCAAMLKQLMVLVRVLTVAAVAIPVEVAGSSDQSASANRSASATRRNTLAPEGGVRA